VDSEQSHGPLSTMHCSLCTALLIVRCL